MTPSNTPSLQSQIDRLLRDVSTIAMGAASKRQPFALNAGGKLHLAVGPLRTFSQTISVTGTDDVDTLCQFARDTLIHYFIARCTDSSGLNAFRFSLTDENGKFLFVDRDEIKDGTQLAPLGAHTLLASADGMDTRPSLGYFMPSQTKFYSRVTNVYGTAPYTVDLTCVYQSLTPQAG